MTLRASTRQGKTVVFASLKKWGGPQKLYMCYKVAPMRQTIETNIHNNNFTDRYWRFFKEKYRRKDIHKT